METTRRNLLGRLHARPPADLEPIAAFWQAPLGTGDRFRQIGSLYRVMIDPDAARDVWDRLDADEAELVRLLAVGEPEAALTLDELADRLQLEPSRARDAAIRLYRGGVLARAGDGRPTPVGEQPRLFLPRELTMQFRRVLDEIDMGDQSRAPLSALLAWLDESELDEAATVWGAPSPPGVVRREDITRRLLRQTSNPEQIARVASSLRRDARALWNAVQTAEGEPASLPRAMDQAGLAAPGAPAAARRRTALADIQRSLLVWHTYRPDGSRWLFIPAEIRRPPETRPAAPALDFRPPDPDHAVRWLHPDAVAWDLLTMLQELGDAPWPLEPAAAERRARATNLADRLWFGRETGAALPAYLDGLLALAREEELVAPAASEPPVLTTTDRIGEWRAAPFPEQTRRLRARWFDAPAWLEGQGQEELEIRGADWPRARKRLLAALVDRDVGWRSGEWVTVDSLAARIAALDPRLPGASFSAATARFVGPPGAGDDPDLTRIGAVAEIVARELTTAFAWFGLVELAMLAGPSRGARFTELGRALAEPLVPAAAPAPEDPGEPGPPGGFWRGGQLRPTSPPEPPVELPPRRFRFSRGVRPRDEIPALDATTGSPADDAVRRATNDSAATQPRPNARNTPDTPPGNPVAPGTPVAPEESAPAPDRAETDAPDMTPPERSTPAGEPGPAAPATNAAGIGARDPVPAEPPGSPPVEHGPALTIDAEGGIVLHYPTPARVWTLNGMAAVVALANPARYKLTPETPRRALARGADLPRIMAWLERQSGAALPDPVRTRLEGWAARVRRARARPVIAIEVDHPRDMSALLELATAEGWRLETPTDRLALLSLAPGISPDDVAAVLRRAGFLPE